MSYEKLTLESLEPREIDGIEPQLLAVGYELRPSKMRPSVWEFEEGDANNRHRHRDQEELYVVLKGTLRMEIDDDTIDLEEGDYVVVDPDSWRQLVAEAPSRVLAIGAPNVKDDDIQADANDA